MRLYTRKGQSTLEYAFLLAIIISAIITVQVYVRRGLIGNIRDTAEDRLGAQFRPYNTHGTMHHSSSGQQEDKLTTAGNTTSTLTGLTQKDDYNGGSETVDKFDPKTEKLF